MKSLNMKRDWLYQKYILEKMSTYEIASIYKYSQKAVYNWLIKFGIKPRTKSQAQILLPRRYNKPIKIHLLGYVLEFRPSHPNGDKHGYVLQHRLVMEKYLGRHLSSEEVIHHKNEMVYDNKIENLELFNSKREHLAFHLKKANRIK